MKLKKIVSLALAGVLAVSMLAGCKSTGAASSNGGASSEAPAATGMVGKVIAELSKTTTDKVTFTSDSTLQKVLDIVIEKTGGDETDMGTIEASNLTDVVSSLGSTSKIPGILNQTSDDSSDATKQTSIFVDTIVAADETAAASQLANIIETTDVALETNGKIAGLPAVSTHDSKNEYHYDFDYTGKIAVSSATDPTTGKVSYVIAFTITRTPTKVDCKGND